MTGKNAHKSPYTDISPALAHLAFYAGWPPAGTAVGIARQVFAEAGV